jgi:hypothetical protein
VFVKSIEQNQYDTIIEGSTEYEDGETGMINCIEKYCEENNVDLVAGYAAYDYYINKKALQAGIPLIVIEGHKKLSDCFSSNYINWKCNKVR